MSSSAAYVAAQAAVYHAKVRAEVAEYERKVRAYVFNAESNRQAPDGVIEGECRRVEDVPALPAPEPER